MYKSKTKSGGSLHIGSPRLLNQNITTYHSYLENDSSTQNTRMRHVAVIRSPQERNLTYSQYNILLTSSQMYTERVSATTGEQFSGRL